jgi:hypothetical protein
MGKAHEANSPPHTWSVPRPSRDTQCPSGETGSPSPPTLQREFSSQEWRLALAEEIFRTDKSRSLGSPLAVHALTSVADSRWASGAGDATKEVGRILLLDALEAGSDWLIRCRGRGERGVSPLVESVGQTREYSPPPPWTHSRHTCSGL